MLTIKIRGASTLAKMAEVKPVLGSQHQFGTYWREGALCVDYLHREDAQMTVVQLNLIHGIHAEIDEPR